MARPTKLTADVRAAIADSLSSGVDAETAARASGISLRTFQRWVARGVELRIREEEGKRIRSEDRIYLGLLDEIEIAGAQAEVRALKALQRAMESGDWRAAAFYMERVIPGKYTPIRRQTGRPKGATSAPDRPSTAGAAPPRVRLRAVE